MFSVWCLNQVSSPVVRTCKADMQYWQHEGTGQGCLIATTKNLFCDKIEKQNPDTSAVKMNRQTLLISLRNARWDGKQICGYQTGLIISPWSQRGHPQWWQHLFLRPPKGQAAVPPLVEGHHFPKAVPSMVGMYGYPRKIWSRAHESIPFPCSFPPPHSWKSNTSHIPYLYHLFIWPLPTIWFMWLVLLNLNNYASSPHSLLISECFGLYTLLI